MRIMNEISYLDAARRRLQRVRARRSGTVRYSGHVHHRGRMVADDGARSRRLPHVSAEGRLSHRRRFQSRRAIGWAAAAGRIFEENMRRVLPGAQFVDMDAAHPIFHAFFEIKIAGRFSAGVRRRPPIFRGIYEDNDPKKRLKMIVNYNTDISQFWEWSGRGLRPFDDTNEAYKLGVNYVIYGLMH